jgi:hypothetical protein
MRTEKELLDSMKTIRAERVRQLMMKDKTQLIKLIERLGQFSGADEDIAWLEQKINKVEAN